MGEGVDANDVESMQRPAIAANRTDRRRSLEALHGLESFAAGAAPGRETEWSSDVRGALGVLEAALIAQARRSGESASPRARWRRSSCTSRGSATV
jgi:hypothetical protein